MAVESPFRSAYNVNVKNEIKLKKVTQLQIDFLQFADGASIPGAVYEPGFHVWLL